MTEFDKDQFENTELENEKFESIEELREEEIENKFDSLIEMLDNRRYSDFVGAIIELNPVDAADFFSLRVKSAITPETTLKPAPKPLVEPMMMKYTSHSALQRTKKMRALVSPRLNTKSIFMQAAMMGSNSSMFPQLKPGT